MYTIKTYTPETLAKEIKSAVEWLKEEDCGCVTLKLNGTLAVCIGWSDGFDPDDETVIHSKASPTYAIVAAIKVWTTDDMRTDIDWVDAPYYEDESVYDDEIFIGYDDNYELIAEGFLKDFEELKELDIDENGRIWMHRYYVCAIGYDLDNDVTDFEKTIEGFDKYEDAYECFVKAQSSNWKKDFKDHPDLSYIQLQLEECREALKCIECVDIKNEWIINKN